ncbi:hypothetical protein GCM10009609_51410 [Pseudonocardia aurantiaca]|uniref:Uncharacterized protein n=1 Tax=Pseudonocardia aurantiaca TaxID=75290 RepID=A0ABW4FRI8_9PSEU
MTRFDDIPSAATPPPGARPSPAVARIRALRPSRRTVLRALVIGAAAAALVPLDWYLSRGASAAPDRNPEDSSEHRQCTPRHYDEEANNWPATGPAVCYGGWRRGNNPCENGYHIEGRYQLDDEDVESTRLTTNCHGKNAWRWNGYRCSDAITDVTFSDGTTYHGLTIAACRLPADEGMGDRGRGLLRR